MQKSQIWRDLSIALFALLFGTVLVWAGSNNGIDLVMTIMILMLPLISLGVVAHNWPKPDMDKEIY